MRIRSTTIVAMLRDGQMAMAGDGQVTFDKTVMKHGARKVRRMAGGKVVGGFAGSAADGLSLFEKLEAKLEEYNGNLLRAAVELAKDWRSDKYLRRLEALLVVGNKDTLLVLSGNGDVIEPDDQIASIGSGSPYALAAARALARNTSLPADAVVRESLRIASEICIYTNDQIVVETL
ncbi:MAG: ATP-dependent protease subunit HslV [Proteobacteria bacterium]|nr:ATP-dependent protease subunit HslV [Pseudomonadota bacterium]